jgi:hypothetical protein
MKRTKRLGTHWVIDDITGFKVRSDRIRTDWRGIVSDQNEWSPKHPQLDLRSRSEDVNVTPTRTRPNDKFVTSVDPNSLNQR